MEVFDVAGVIARGQTGVEGETSSYEIRHPRIQGRKQLSSPPAGKMGLLLQL